MGQYKIREYHFGDEEKISNLLDKFTPHKRDMKFWVWINQILPIKKNIIVVGEYNGEIVGHYAISPQHINFFGETLNSGIGIHAFVHPEHRKNMIIFQITKKAFDLAKDRELDFIYGFPNKNFRLISERIDKWKKIDLFKSFEKEIYIKNKIHYDTIEVRPDNIFLLYSLLDKNTKNDFISISKNINYYLHRYILHPHKLYINLFLYKNDKLVGFVVYKIYENSKIHIIDYILSENMTYDNLISFTENSFVKKVSLWPSTKEELFILQKKNYNPIGFETYFGVKFINENLSQRIKNKILEKQNWILKMGDSDAF